MKKMEAIVNEIIDPDYICEKPVWEKQEAKVSEKTVTVDQGCDPSEFFELRPSD